MPSTINISERKFSLQFGGGSVAHMRLASTSSSKHEMSRSCPEVEILNSKVFISRSSSPAKDSSISMAYALSGYITKCLKHLVIASGVTSSIPSTQHLPDSHRFFVNSVDLKIQGSSRKSEKLRRSSGRQRQQGER